jgi:hypothetical protein
MDNQHKLLAINYSSATSSYVCPVDDTAELLIVGGVVAPDDAPADHAGLCFALAWPLPSSAK